MAVDTFAKRMTVAGLPASMVGPNVFPGTTATSLGRAAAAWNYVPAAPTPGAGGDVERPVLGLTWSPSPPRLGEIWG